MNKAGLIEVLVGKVEGLSKKQAETMIDTFVETVTSELKKDSEVTIAGFGTFSAKKRASRVGINPQTKEKLQIPAITVPKFKAGKTLKDALKQSF